MSEKGKEGFDSLPPPYSESMTSGYVPPPAAPSPVGAVQQPQQPKNVVYLPTAPIPAHEVPDHLTMAILATVCCCLPLGIVAIVKSSDCRSQRAVGNRELALRSSRSARKWSLWAIGLGTLVFLTYLALQVIFISHGIEQDD